MGLDSKPKGRGSEWLRKMVCGKYIQCHPTSPTQELGPPNAADLFVWEEVYLGLQILQKGTVGCQNLLIQILSNFDLSTKWVQVELFFRCEARNGSSSGESPQSLLNGNSKGIADNVSSIFYLLYLLLVLGTCMLVELRWIVWVWGEVRRFLPF